MRIKSLCAFLPDAAAPDSIPLLPEAVWNFLQALRRAAAVLQASDVCQGEISHLQSTESEQYPFSQVGLLLLPSLQPGWALGLWNEHCLACGNRKGFSEKLGTLRAEVFLGRCWGSCVPSGGYSAVLALPGRSCFPFPCQSRGRSWGAALQPARSLSSRSAASQLNNFVLLSSSWLSPPGFC